MHSSTKHNEKQNVVPTKVVPIVILIYCSNQNLLLTKYGLQCDNICLVNIKNKKMFLILYFLSLGKSISLYHSQKTDHLIIFLIKSKNISTHADKMSTVVPTKVLEKRLGRLTDIISLLPDINFLTGTEIYE